MGEDRRTYFEVVNEGFHGLLHGCSRRWDDLVVIDLDCTCWHLVQALFVSVVRVI
jgi:hypothetical protein